MASLKNMRNTAVGLILLLTLSACFENNDDVDDNNNPGLRGYVMLDVYKSPTCACCGKWVEHMASNGFYAQTHDTADLAAIKTQYGISPQYRSCHTAVSSQGHVFEGHVPARFIHQFLGESHDNAIGLAVPAMPLGSPGMEVGDKFMPYQVLILNKDGSSEVYANVDAMEDQH